MSADFFSFVVPISPAEGERLYQKWQPREVLGDVVGPDEQTLHRFERDGELDVAAIATAYDGEPAPVGFLESAYVDIPLEDVTQALRDPLMSPNYPSIVALDRAFALPRGVSLLDGRALRVLSLEEVAAVHKQLGHALADEGEEGVVEVLAPHLDRYGNGPDDARAMWRVLWAGLLEARAEETSLLLAGCPVP
ncbi:MAG: hypothetical protein AAGE52_40030 [Myxococcota bacterium]